MVAIVTQARRHQFDSVDPPWVHVVSRCVRRAFLTGGRYEHRKRWIEDRLSLLASIFAVEVAGYSVMSNHLHAVLRMQVVQVGRWSDEDVVRRWWSIYPRQRLRDGTPVPATKAQVSEQARNTAWVAVRRQRLADLGWLMKSLKEDISRRANREDGCSGAFWEGRFTSVPLLDNAALIACMAYVDLNPVRAGITPTPEASTYTGAQTRIAARHGGKFVHWLAPLACCTVAQPEGTVVPEVEAPFSEDEYLTLLDATGRSLAKGKKGRIDPALPSLLARLDLEVEAWIATMVGWRMLWGGSAIGTAASRSREATRRGLEWIRNRSPLFAAAG